MKSVLRYSIALIASLFLIVSSAICQWNWQISQSVGTGLQRVDASYCIDANTGIIGGSNQAIPAPESISRMKKTTNGGVSWTTVFEGDTGSVYDIQFVNANVGFAVTYNGVTRTLDGGDNWMQVFDTVGGMNAVHFRNELEGYACGGLYTKFMRTVDGGDTWSLVNFPASDYPILRGVHFTSAATGYVVSGSTYNDGFGFVGKTTDGGNTWTQLPTGLTMEFFGFTFLDDNTIYAYGVYNSDARIVRSVDAGATWSVVPIQLPVPGIVTDLVFTSPSHGWFSTIDNKIYVTYNGGATWAFSYNAVVFGAGVYTISQAGGVAYGFGYGNRFIKNNSFVGVEELEQQLGATIWPNPNNGQGFDIQLEGTPSANTTLEITDLQGRLVHKEQFSSMGMPYRISFANTLKSGFYQCAVSSGARQWAARLVVD